MAIKFNPFTGNFDLTGSGGGGASYIDGEVATYTDLSLDAGVAPLNTAWLVREASGAWLLARKPAGIYIRTATAGVSRDADYTYAGILPDVFNDANFLLYDNGDPTKNLQFQLSGITTGQTRTLTVPNSSGTISLSGHTHIASDIIFGQFANNRINWASPDPIGSSVPQSGTFTTLAANNGTLTASAPVLDLAQTWNNAGVTFTGVRLNVTNTASAAASRLLSIQAGGTDRFSILPTGGIQLNHVNNTVGINLQENWQALHISVGSTTFGSGSTTAMRLYGAGTGSSRIQFYTNLGLQIMASNNLASGAAGAYVIADGDDTLAQRRTTNPQTFRLYNSFTSATNFERLAIGWASNVVSIKPEAGGAGGTVRELHISGLPTANPGPGILWNDGGTVKVGT